MPRNFNPAAWRERLALLTGRRLSRDPRFMVQVGLAVLLAAICTAAFFVVRPLGGSPEELARQASALESQIGQRRATAGRLTLVKDKTSKARAEGDRFLSAYFMDRRTASSTITLELSKMARDAGIRPKDHTFSYEPIEGSETLTMMIIAGNYEGTYSDLMRYINKLDRTPRFVIIDQLSAAPQSGSAILAVQMKLYTFVKEGGSPADAAALLRREEKTADKTAQPAGAPAPQAGVPQTLRTAPIIAAPMRPSPIMQGTPAPVPVPVQPAPEQAATPVWQGPPAQAPDGTNFRPMRPGGPRRRIPRPSEDQE
jgi:hypothetical protein